MDDGVLVNGGEIGCKTCKASGVDHARKKVPVERPDRISVSKTYDNSACSCWDISVTPFRAETDVVQSANDESVDEDSDERK